MSTVNIYGIIGGRKRLAYTGTLPLAAERCNMTEAAFRKALQLRVMGTTPEDRRFSVPQPESPWPRADQYFATFATSE